MNGTGRELELTSRQRAVLRLYVTGSTVKEIAEELRLSPSTVYEHLERVRARLGVKTDAQLVAHALRNGLDGREG